MKPKKGGRTIKWRGKGKDLQELRAACNLTQSELAGEVRSGVTERIIANWEHNRGRPSGGRLEQLALAYSRKRVKYETLSSHGFSEEFLDALGIPRSPTLESVPFDIVPSGAELRDRLDGLQYCVAAWDGLWGETAEEYKKSLTTLRDRLFRSASEEFCRAKLLEGYFYLKGGGSALWDYYRSGGWGFLRWCRDKARTELDAAATWLLGRLYAGFASWEDQDRKRQLLKASYECFDAIKGPIKLPSPVLLPGVRSEFPPEKFYQEVAPDRDPLVMHVSVPHRYRSDLALSLSAEARRKGDQGASEEYLAAARQSFQASRQLGLGTDQIRLNIQVNEFNAELLERRNNLHKLCMIRNQIEALIGSINDSSASVGEAKREEWLANCYAGMICVSQSSRERVENLTSFQSHVERVIRVRRGNVFFFRIDPIYVLCKAQFDEIDSVIDSELKTFWSSVRAQAQEGSQVGIEQRDGG